MQYVTAVLRLDKEEEMEDKNKKPNGFSYFTLGFSTATLIYNIAILILKLKQ